jgi:hypothetical protein
MSAFSKTILVVAGYIISGIALFILVILIAHAENVFLNEQAEEGKITLVTSFFPEIALFFNWLYIFSAILIGSSFIGFLIARRKKDPGLIRGFKITNIMSLLLLAFLIILYAKDVC